MTNPKGAFDDLFHQTYDMVLRYAMRRLPGRAQADDVTSEVFSSAWRTWERGEQVALPWLLQVARNKIADHYRRESRLRGAQADLAQLLEDTDTPSQEDHVALWLALGQLGEREREALTLTYWDGLSGAEIAQVLGCTVTTVWALLSRGRRKLRRLLEGNTGAITNLEGGVRIEVHGE